MTSPIKTKMILPLIGEVLKKLIKIAKAKDNSIIIRTTFTCSFMLNLTDTSFPIIPKYMLIKNKPSMLMSNFKPKPEIGLRPQNDEDKEKEVVKEIRIISISRR